MVLFVDWLVATRHVVSFLSDSAEKANASPCYEVSWVSTRSGTSDCNFVEAQADRNVVLFVMSSVA